MITPFDYYHTNDFLTKAKDYSIEGVIIQYDKMIESAGYYSTPELIAMVNEEDGEALRKVSQPLVAGAQCKMRHRYRTNCSIITS